MDWQKQVDALEKEYENIFNSKDGKPNWAFRKNDNPEEIIHCTIPFVGKNYTKQSKKVLLYASAENLMYYKHREKCWYDLADDEFAKNRHRKCFDKAAAEGKEFYPSVHIAPIQDGSLALATMYIYSRIIKDVELKPTEFLENIALANYCKFSIETNSANIDYANDFNKLKELRKYIEADIGILNPDFIIMPKKIYDTERVFINSIKGNATIIPINQINASVINRHIARRNERYDKDKLTPAMLEWYNHLGKNGITGKTKENYLSVFSYLDKQIETWVKQK